MSSIELLQEKIRKYSAKHGAILAVYIFGSYIKGRQKAGSDLDIAILLERTHPALSSFDTLKSTAELSLLLKQEVHILVLNEASYLARMEVYKTGRLVYAKSIAREKAEKAKNIMLYLDFQPILAFHQKRVARHFSGRK